MGHDLTRLVGAFRSGAARARDAAEASIAAAAAPACRHAFVAVDAAAARDAAAAADAAADAGRALPLGGAAVGVKDLFDVAGQVTTAGSPMFADAAPAERDAVAVARLRRAGAALVGRTNMTELAFSGVGINPHFGTPANAAPAYAGAAPRIPGGSTAGGAVSVATGAAWAALGSDTGGSIRIPAALHGLVGFKNTQRLTPNDGAMPLSTTLDTTCAITRSVRDAVLLHEILADRRAALGGRPLHACRFAVPSTVVLDGVDAGVAAAFARAVGLLRDAGARVDEIALAPLGELAALNAAGGFAAAESWASYRHRLAERGDLADPRVAARIRRGAALSAADYVDLVRARAGWIRRMDAALRDHDAMLSPTLPIVAPPLGALLADDAAFFAANAALLRNPSVVNFLDGCALSLPCQAEGEAPVGLMVWSGALRDDTVLDVSLAIEAHLASRLGPAVP